MRKPHAKLRPGTRALLVACPLAAIALSLPLYQLSGAPALLREAWAAALAAAVLYGLSHVLRAARLALLAAPALTMHVRTILLLHFHTAPVSFIVPFKLGELYRWQQLAWLSGKPVGSLLILLLDRMLDAIVLLAVLAVATALGGRMPPHTIVVSGLLALATTLGLFAVLVAPGCLQAMQAYILQNHSAPRARKALRIIDGTRLTFNGARQRLHGNVSVLLFLSAAIWALESGMLLLLARALGGSGTSITLLTQTLFPQAADEPMLAIMSLYVLVCLGTLLVVWPVATTFYLMRIHSPLRSPPRPSQPLSARRTRRLHLRATARSL